MSILNTKNRNAPLRQVQGGAKARPQARPKETKQTKEDRPQGAAARAPTQAEKDQADIDALSARFHQAEADRLENSYVGTGSSLCCAVRHGENANNVLLGRGYWRVRWR